MKTLTLIFILTYVMLICNCVQSPNKEQTQTDVKYDEYNTIWRELCEFNKPQLISFGHHYKESLLGYKFTIDAFDYESASIQRIDNSFFGRGECFEVTPSKTMVWVDKECLEYYLGDYDLTPLIFNIELVITKG